MNKKKILITVTFLAVSLFFFFQSKENTNEQSGIENNSPEQSIPDQNSTAASRNSSSEEKIKVTTAEATNPIVQGPWGTLPGQFGKTDSKESNAEGPSAIGVDANGNVFVLDQVNKRLQRFSASGEVSGIFDISSTSVEDFAFDTKGRIVTLDRDKNGVIEIINPSDNSRTKLSDFRKDEQSLTGVFTNGTSIFTETHHSNVYRIADDAGLPISEKVPGRPNSVTNTYVRVGIVNEERGGFFIENYNASGSLLWDKYIYAEERLLQLLMQDTDAQGNIYVGLETEKRGGNVPTQTLVYRVSPNGETLNKLVLPPTTQTPYSTFRPLSVDKNGGIYQLQTGENGLKIYQYK